MVRRPGGSDQVAQHAVGPVDVGLQGAHGALGVGLPERLEQFLVPVVGDVEVARLPQEMEIRAGCPRCFLHRG